MRFIRLIIATLLVLFIGFASAVFIYLQSSRPVYHGELHDRDVKEEVKVFFDHYGIPHIYAKNNEDAYFTLGYIHAQERLFQMELLRRVGAGRLAEIFGKEFIKTDALFRTLGINKLAQESATMFFSKPTDEWQRNTLSYLKGINSFIFQGPTPPEFIMLGIPKVAFTPEDIYLITGYMAFSFAEALRIDPIMDKIYRQYGSNYTNAFNWTEPASPILPADTSQEVDTTLSAFLDQAIAQIPIKPWIGSNAWLLAPKRSKSGGVLLANDTHMGYQQPCVWYEAHLEYPGHSSYGNYLAGLPFPLVGHNQNTAWGMTMFENDDMNLYREQTDPHKINSYYYKGNWENFKTSEEIISVKGGNDTTIIVRETVHGPIINDVVSQLDKSETSPISLWWTYPRFPVTVLQVTNELLQSVNINDGRNAAAKVNAPGLNILFGDNEGNIAFWAAAKLPIYKKGQNTKLILDGSEGNDDILGFYDFKDNPQSENPESGVLISANQSPDSVNGEHYPGYYAPPYRSERLKTLLSQNEKWNIDELKRISTDVTTNVHAVISRYIISVIGNDTILNLSSTHKESARLLKNWSGNHSVTDTTPTIYYKLLSTILELSMRDELGDTNYKILVNTHLMKDSYLKFLSDSASGWWDNNKTDRIETRKEIFIEAFRMTIRDMQKSSGDITNWAWGGSHTLEHVHPIGKMKPFDKIFNVGPSWVMGGIETINNASFPLNTSGKYHVSYGPALRTLIDLNDIEHGWNILPTGQSGHLRSPHYFDQFKMHINGQFRPMMMNTVQIRKTCTNILTFVPKIN